ncbi:hypothetical protein [Chitinimonas naiadis]
MGDRFNSQSVQDLYTAEQFEAVLKDAEMNASTDWEEEFVADLITRFKEFGRRMYLSDSQNNRLQQINDQ